MKKVKYLGIVVVTLLVLVLGAKFLIFNATPTEKLFAGMKKATNKKDFSQKIDLSFEVMNTDSMTDILNDMNIELLIAQDKTGTKSSIQGNILLSDESLVQSILAIDGQSVYFDLMDLYEKYFYIDGSEISGEEVNTNALMNREYIKNFKLTGIDQKKYEKAFEEVLGDNIKKVDGKINLKMNLNSFIEVINEFVKVAESDEKLKKALYVDGKALLEKIKEDEAIVSESEKEEIDMILNEFFKDQETFNSKFDELIINLKQQLEVTKEQMILVGNMVTFEMNFDIDMFNNLKTADIKVTVPGISINAFIDNTVKVDLEKYNKEEAINLMELQESEEAYEVLQEVMNNLSTKLASNDRLVKYLEENEILEKYFYGVESIDELFNMLMQMIMMDGVY